MRKQYRRWPAIAACIMLLAAACGDSDSSEPAEQPSSPATEAATATAEPETAEPETESELAGFESALAAAYAGTFAAPPTAAPPLPAESIDVWWLSCGEFTPYCAFGSAGAVAAGEALGWDVTVVDAFADPMVGGNLIRDAVAASVDAIVINSIDCDGIRGPLADADEAGVAVIAITSQYCSDEDLDNPTLFDGVVTYVEGDFTDWYYAIGEAMANWIVVKTQGEARVLTVTNNEAVVFRVLGSGFMDRMSDCSNCQVYEFPILLADFGGDLQTKSEQAMLQNPDVNAVAAMGDTIVQMGLGPAILATDDGADLHVMGLEGLAPSPDLARLGVQQDAGVGAQPEWEAYAALDTVIRVLAGEESVSSGIGVQVWDVDNNLPPEGGSYDSGVDFVQAYLDAWGVG